MRKGITFHEFQFFNEAKLRPLLEKQKGIVQRTNEDGTTEIEAVQKVKLSAKEDRLKGQLLAEGFQDWTRRDFNLFVRACAEHGRDDLAQIAAEFDGTKTQADIEKYSVVFWDKGPDMLSDWDKHQGKIEDGEKKLERLKDMILAFELKCSEYDDPVWEMELAGRSVLGFSEQADSYLVWATNQLGWGNWDSLQKAVSVEALFRFDLFMRSRTATELRRRVEQLARHLEKELAAPLAKERKKRKKASEALAQK